MKEITLKEWSAYLPYGLKLWYEDNKDIYPLVVSNNTVSIRGGFNINDVKSYNLKPILYDLSWLTREIEFGGEKFIPNHDPLFKYFIPYELEEFKNSIPYSLSFEQYEKLLEWKFNVFNLPDELIVRVTEDFNPYK